MAVGLNALTLASRGADGLFNDFYDYWGAAHLVAAGGNPYDSAGLAAVLEASGIHFQVGTGYSYPAFFSYLVLPLAALRPGVAAIVFTVVSLVALTLAVGLMLSSLHHLHWLELTVLAGLSGGFTAVVGSLYFGQANLLLLPLLALAARGVAAPVLLAIVGAVKLYPAAGLAALAAQGRAALARVLVGVGLLALLLAVPNLVLGARGAGGADRLAGFLEPDSFWTNQSVNGFVSRLALASDATRPPLPGLPVTPTMVALVLLLGLAAVVVVAVRRGTPFDGCLALMLGWGVIAAPKDSLWNYVPLVLALVFCWSRVRRRPALLGLLILGYALIELQSRIDVVRDTFYRASPAMTWFSSLALAGAVLICVLTAFLVLRETA